MKTIISIVAIVQQTYGLCKYVVAYHGGQNNSFLSNIVYYKRFLSNTQRISFDSGDKSVDFRDVMS